MACLSDLCALRGEKKHNHLNGYKNSSSRPAKSQEVIGVDKEVTTMDIKSTMRVESTFLSLPGEERETIISLGATLRLSYLKKRLFLAENKIKNFQEHYGTTLAQLEAEGLPDDADYRMHEDYIMWCHWSDVVDKAKTDIAALEGIVQQGLYLRELTYAGR